jgi:hypothetical protein
MESEIEFVETLATVVVQHRALIAYVLIDLGQKVLVGFRGDGAHRLRFQCASYEHGLATIGEIDEGYARAALWQHLDQSLVGKAPERFRHWKSRYAELCAQRGLVDVGSGLEFMTHDRVTDEILNALNHTPTPLSIEGG